MKLSERLGHGILGMVMLTIAVAAYRLALELRVSDVVWVVWGLAALCLLCGVTSLVRAMMPD